MYTIQANPTGTRFIEVSEEHLKTIDKYSLFKHLIDSNGYIDENVIEKLRLNARSIIDCQETENKELLDLCANVIYHKDMKTYGLKQLIILYLEWIRTQNTVSKEI